MPSLFSNEYSRGPLYQYWRERGGEETGLRTQRVEEAKLRAKGLKPLDAAYGPSSTESYARRESAGPPAYIGEGSGAAATVGEGDALPAYVDTTTSPQDGRGAGDRGLLSAEEEKARLARLQEQHQRTQSDAAIARSLSDDLAREDAQPAEGTGIQPERRKSKVGKVGRWLADAASGYTKNQERW